MLEGKYMGSFFWCHKDGFRSPTEQQLVGWETDGGNFSEFESAELCNGRLYTCKFQLAKARLLLKIDRLLKVVKLVQVKGRSHEYSEIS